MWILDSRATEHMTSDKEKHTNLKSHTSTVEIANSEPISVTGSDINSQFLYMTDMKNPDLSPLQTCGMLQM